MNRIHIVGRKNHGKTTLIVELLSELRNRGVRVGSIKHSSHVHDLDTPGKDSYRHRMAGGQPAAIVTLDSVGVFLPRSTASAYDQLEPLYADCELVLVEGDVDATGKKIEVWRAAVGTPSLATERSDILAVISDDPLHLPIPIWPRGDVTDLADQLLALCDTRAIG